MRTYSDPFLESTAHLLEGIDTTPVTYTNVNIIDFRSVGLANIVYVLRLIF